MEFDKAQLVHDAAEAVWDRRNIMGMEAPFSEQGKMVQFSLKNQIMPTILFALPVVENAVKNKLKEIIEGGHAVGASADMILLDISFELDNLN